MGFSMCIPVYMREREHSYRNNDDDNSYNSSICMVWCSVYYLFIHSTPGTHIYIYITTIIIIVTSIYI